jgi:hypothetical protein
MISKYFTMYLVIGMPISICLFVVLSRYRMDVDVSAFLSMIVASALPIFREVLIIMLFMSVYDWKPNLDKVLFKKKP